MNELEHFWELVIMAKTNSQFYRMDNFFFKQINNFELRN